MEVENVLEIALVPAGLGMLMAYHAWLFCRIKQRPRSTVIGINALNRRVWVDAIMSEGMKHGVLAVQTMRNNIMAATLLASMAIMLTSAIGVMVSGPGWSMAGGLAVGGEKPNKSLSSTKYLCILVCFLGAFLCNVQSIRYYSHVSILISVPLSKPILDLEGGFGIDGFNADEQRKDYVCRALNKGSYFWSIGLRAFYFSIPIFLWTFGPVPMFFTSILMVFLLFSLDIVPCSNKPSLAPISHTSHSMTVPVDTNT